MLTSALGSETLNRHNKALGNECADTLVVEPFVNFVGAVDKQADCYIMVMGIGSDIPGLYAWSRVDMGSRTLRTFLRG